jgi:molecular chaperone Hsp33
VKIAAGFMLQAMPGCNLEKFDILRKNIVSEKFANLLMTNLPSEKKLWKLVAAATGSDDPKQLSYSYGNSPGFRCSCSLEKMRSAMSVLDKNELTALFKENPHPGITCNFCRQQYHFLPKDFGITL